MSVTIKELIKTVKKTLPKHLDVVISETEFVPVFEVSPTDLTALLSYLRDNSNTQFKQLMDVAGVDYPEKAKRFEVVYQLLSLKHNIRATVKVHVDEYDLLPSVTDIYNSAAWFEREVFDMYGVKFSGHPDLRRILTDYGFEGHPQRKDFPLTGHIEVRYDYEKKKVVYEPVKLAQEYRSFDYESPWEGGEYILPGDEKAKEAS